jgi:DNA primase
MKLSVEVLKTLIENSSLDFRKKNVIGKCPYCGFDEFGISIENNHRFGCFRKGKCGEVGNIFKLLKKVNRLDLFADADNVTLTSSNYVEDIISEQTHSIPVLPEIQLPIGWRRIYENEYLKERGFTEEDFKCYEVGLTRLDSKLKDYIVFLTRQKDKLVGTVARYIKSKEEIKNIEEKTGKRVLRYRNSSTDFESLLLGIDECTNNTDTVILVEGLFGKRSVDEKLRLREQEEIKCLCTFGAKISETQLLLLHLAGISSIILFFDPDVINHIKKYSARLADEFQQVKIALIKEKGKDPADLTEDEMIEVFSNLLDPLNFQINTVSILDLK